jgi:hypothetical protein
MECYIMTQKYVSLILKIFVYVFFIAITFPLQAI